MAIILGECGIIWEIFSWFTPPIATNGIPSSSARDKYPNHIASLSGLVGVGQIGQTLT